MGKLVNRRHDIADVTLLIGRRFVSARHNVATVYKLADGALHINWKTKPTEEDKQDFFSFAESVLGPLNPTEHSDPATEQAALRKWQERSE